MFPAHGRRTASAGTVKVETAKPVFSYGVLIEPVMSFLPESRISAASRWLSARVKPASTSSASCSPVMRMTVLFVLLTGKFRSITVHSSLLIRALRCWSRMGPAGREPVIWQDII